MGAGFQQGSVFHIQGDLVDPSHISACADLLMTTSPNVLIYSAMDGWRRQMVEEGEHLLEAALQCAERLRAQIDQMPGLLVLDDELIRAEASHDLDRLQVLIDLQDLGISGYQAADWLREHERIDVGLSDHARILATTSISDDHTTLERLTDALTHLAEASRELPRPPEVRIPTPHDMELETVKRPRDAFFGPAETVPVEEAAGRVVAEQITPYPPGIPAVLPGERLNQPVLDYLRSGLEAGMVLPDPQDPDLKTIRVSREF
jgi:lysine decarboxylase